MTSRRPLHDKLRRRAIGKLEAVEFQPEECLEWWFPGYGNESKLQIFLLRSMKHE